jgi:hypothetical protein
MKRREFIAGLGGTVAPPPLSGLNEVVVPVNPELPAGRAEVL